MPTATTLGQAGLQGWREKVADGIAEPVARRAPLEAEQVRALLGVALLRPLGDVRGQDAQRRGAGSAARGESPAEGHHLERRPPLLPARRAGRCAGRPRARRGRAPGGDGHDPSALAGRARTDRATARPRLARHRRALPRPGITPAHRSPPGVGRPAAGPDRGASGSLAGDRDGRRGRPHHRPGGIPLPPRAERRERLGQAATRCRPCAPDLEAAPPTARVVCGDLNTPRRELETGEVISFARDSRGLLRPERGQRWDEAELGVVPGSEGHRLHATPSARCTATPRGSRAGPGSGSQGTAVAGASITSSPRAELAPSGLHAITTPGATPV